MAEEEPTWSPYDTLNQIHALAEQVKAAQATHKRPRRHFEGCYEYHAGCLAQVICDLANGK